MEEFDWNQLQSISFTFLPHNEYRDAHKLLNDSVADTISDITDLFLDANAVPRVLAPSPMATIRRLIQGSIVATIVDASNGDQNQIDPRHVQHLLDACIFRASSSNVVIRTAARLTEAARAAVTQGNNTLSIAINFSTWYIRNFKTWRALDFQDIATTTFQNQDGDNTEAANENQTNNGPTGEELQALRGLAQSIELLNSRMLAQEATRTNTDSTSTGNALDDVPINPQTLPEPVRVRYAMHKDKTVMTGKDMVKFEYTLNGIDIKTNYYINGDPPGSGYKLILRNGMEFNLEGYKESSKSSSEKAFRINFPKLLGNEPSQLRKWYREITTFGNTNRTYIHPYFLFRKESGDNKGFTIGDSENDDIPERMRDKINNWGILVYDALKGKDVIPETCREQKQIVNNYETGQGYETLFALIRHSHPTFDKHPIKHVSDSPKQGQSESLEHYFFRFQDYIHLKAFLENQKLTMGDINMIDQFIYGARYATQLWAKTDEERNSDDPHKQSKYTAGSVLHTLSTYEKEIVEMKRNEKPKPKLHSPSKYKPKFPKNVNALTSSSSNISQAPSALTNPSTIRHPLYSIKSEQRELLYDIPLPSECKDDIAPDTFKRYCAAVNEVKIEPRKFSSTSDPCLICDQVGHAFEGCPILNNHELLKEHMKIFKSFVRKALRMEDQWRRNQQTGQRQISHLRSHENRVTYIDNDENSEDGDTAPYSYSIESNQESDFPPGE